MNNENSFLKEDEYPSEKINIIKEKLAASWGSARDQLGVINNQRLAELFYQSLYLTDEFTENDIVERTGFNRSEVLKENLNFKSHPEKEVFIQEIIRTLVKEVDYKECLRPGAEEFVGEAMKKGLVTIWTQGDVYGAENYLGSKEQLYKIILSGINELKRQRAQTVGLEKSEVLSVAASENKFTLVDNVLNEYKGKMISKIILVEDRLSNIIKFLNIVKKNNVQIDCVPVWVRQGNSMNDFPKDEGDSIEDYKQKYNAVDQISEVMASLEQKALIAESDKLGFVVDFDDVLSDDVKKMRLQAESVINKLKSKNWLE